MADALTNSILRLEASAAYEEWAAANLPVDDNITPIRQDQHPRAFEYLPAFEVELPIDPVNHPAHYAEGWSNGAEVIDITENLNFNLGNAVKYIARAGRKDPAKLIEDLRKAEWYLGREIARLDGVFQQ
jgi:hypothetical protein